MTFSTLCYISQMNVQDSFINRNLGFELMMGINVNRFAMYFGGGPLQSKAQFMSVGADGITDNSTADTTNSVTETLNSQHTFVGVSLELLNMFLAAQVDRYSSPVYSFKIGFRL